MQEFILIIKPEVLMCAQLKQHVLIDIEELFHSQQALLHWVNRHQVKRVKLIIDLPEEEVYIDPHPELFAWEFKHYAERQRYKRFPATELATTQFDHPSTLPWKMVSGDLRLTGFNDDALIKQVMSWLHQFEVMVTSIHSSMFVLQYLLKHTWFASKAEQTAFAQQARLLLVRIGEQEFRQLLFIQGKLHTSRQVQVQGKPSIEQMTLLLQEVILLDKFVRTQKMLAMDAQLSVCFLGNDEADQQHAWQVFSSSQQIQLANRAHFTSVQHLLADMSDTYLYDRLLAITLSSGRLPADYHTSMTRKTQQLHHAYIGLWVVVAVSVLVLLGYIAAQLTDQYERQQSIQRLVQTQQEQQNYIARFMRYNDIESLSRYHLNDIKLAVDAVHEIEQLQQRQALLPVLAPISHVLAQTEQVALVKLRIDTDVNRQPAGQAKITKAANAPTGELTSLVLSFVIQVSAQDTLAAKIAQVDEFVAALNQADVQHIKKAVLTQAAFDVSSDKALTLHMDEASGQKQFLVPFEVTMQVNHDE